MKQKIAPATLALSGLTACLLSAASASAATVSITTAYGNGADSFINTGNATLRDTNFGNGASMQSKLDASGTYANNTVNRKGYIRFDVSAFDVAASPNATLKLFIAGGWNGSGTIQVYGLNDGDAGENWIEGDGGTADSPVGEIDWNNAPANGGTAATSNTFEASRSTLLGSFTQGSAADGTQILFSGTALNNFLLADTDGLVTLMFLRTTSAVNTNTNWATKENTSFTAPTLEFESVAVVPEPSAAMLFAGAAGLLLRRRRS